MSDKVEIEISFPSQGPIVPNLSMTSVPCVPYNGVPLFPVFPCSLFLFPVLVTDITVSGSCPRDTHVSVIQQVVITTDSCPVDHSKTNVVQSNRLYSLKMRRHSTGQVSNDFSKCVYQDCIRVEPRVREFLLQPRDIDCTGPRHVDSTTSVPDQTRLRRPCG